MANITYIKIEDKVYGLHDENALTSNSNLNASKVVGTLPTNTYVDTTYENKAAVEGGTDVSLVTTGDKYRWNNASGGGISDVEVNGSSVVSGGIAEITVPTNTSDLTNDSNFQNATQVDTAINSRIASVYKAKGSVAFLDLPALTSSNEGFVYDVNESFTTTSDFIEGASITYPAGTNVVIVDIGSGVYKYDVLAGLVDLSGKQDLLISGTNIKTINNNSLLGSGNIEIRGEDSVIAGYYIDGRFYDSVAPTRQEILGELNKIYIDLVTNNLYYYSTENDFILSTDLSGKQDLLVSGTNIKTINSQSLLGSGNLTISGGCTVQIERW